MGTYQVQLKQREEIATGTMAFHFEKPAGFGFKAGQFLTLTLIAPPETDAEGNRRTFSIASAPQEEDLMIATRMRDTAFKRVLKTLPLDTEVKIQGPFGSLTLHSDSTRPVVLLAGGIGITPFRSILLDATKNQLPHRLFLFYSNRRPEDAAFLEEVEELEQENPNYKFIGTMTGMEKSSQPWHGETGYITPALLVKVIDDLTAPIYYVAGPPALVTAVPKMLHDVGVSHENIQAEEFDGY